MEMYVTYLEHKFKFWQRKRTFYYLVLGQIWVESNIHVTFFPWKIIRLEKHWHKKEVWS